MKLVIGALALTLSLAACGGGSSNSAPKKNVDGNYVSISYKGYTDENANKEVREGGHVINLYEVKNDMISLTEIDPQEKNYSTSKYSIDVRGNSSTVALKSHSCEGFEELANKPWKTTVVKDEVGLHISDGGKTERMLEISDEALLKMKEKLKTLEFLNGKCENAPSTIEENDNDDSSVEAKVEAFISN